MNQIITAPKPLGPRTPHDFQPADLGPRLGAALVDLVVISVLSYLVCLPLARFFHLQQAEDILKNTMLQMQRDPMSVDPGLFATLMPMAIGVAVMAVLLLVLMHVYYVYFESTSGQTPGKKLLGLRVVSLEGGRITQNQALYREMIRWYVDGLFVFPAIIAIMATPKRQRVGDILAKTMVVKVPKA